MERSTMSVQELSTRMGISLPKAYELVKQPGFPVLRIGTRILIPVDSFNAWLNRKAEGGEYERIKLAGAGTTSYTDNSSLEEGHYYYKVVAYYQGIDCTAAPAAWVGDDNQYYLHVYYSPTGVEEIESGKMALYPNPTNDCFTVEATGMTHVTVFNMVGQVVYTADCTADVMNINLGNVESGIYMVRVETANGEINGRINVVR